ncbi:lytic murein transglycosylase [Mesorhizobium sp. B2-3-15]|nr:lytic murein transglycosylase [Mesorhizobium sp. B2-3-15]
MTAPATPLWPAGHLPRKGGDRMTFPPSPIASAATKAPQAKLPISPLAGEMAGRPEGGAWARPSKSVEPA